MFKRNNKAKEENRIVKYNIKKIAVIGFIVVGVIVSTSLGIYYAVRPKSNVFAPNVKRRSGKNIQRAINSLKEGEIIGVYFFNSKNDIDLNLVYGEPIKEGGSHNERKADGEFSNYTNTDELVDLYSISKSDNSDLSKEANKIFLKDIEDAEWGIKGFSNIGQDIGSIGETHTTKVKQKAIKPVPADGKNNTIDNLDIKETTFMWFKLGGDNSVIWSYSSGIAEGGKTASVNEFEQASQYVFDNGITDRT